MNVQYLSDAQGHRTAVVISMADWNDLQAKNAASNEPEKPQKKASDFKGLLTSDEADQYHTYLVQARSQWDRDI